jgi:1,4-alpha-glucan branching enzyme
MALKTPQNKEKSRRVSFCLRASNNIHEVILMGDFNQWNPTAHPMKKDKYGVWRKQVLLLPGTYEYKFKVDGEWQMDPDNPLTCLNDYGTRNNFIVINEPDDH